MIVNELSAGKQGPALAPVFSRLIPHLKKPPRPFGQGGASARYHSCFSLCRPSCRYRKKKSPCPYGQGRHTRYHLALYLDLSLTRTNASLTDFNEVLSGDTLLFHTGSHLVRLSVISKSSLLLILACVYEDYYRAEGWTLSRGHRKDLSSGVNQSLLRIFSNSHAFLPSDVSVCCARSPHSSTHRYRPR